MANNNIGDEKAPRRKVLKSIGAAGIGATMGVGSVSGAVADSDSAMSMSGIDRVTNVDNADRTVVLEATGDSVTYEFAVTGLLSPTDAPSDVVKRGTAAGTLEQGSHEFAFTGEFVAFQVDGDATVTVDGDRFEYERFPHNTIEIIASEWVDYEIAASGAVEFDDGDGEKLGDRQLSGTITDGSHTIRYAGEITAFELDGDATIRRNGTQVELENVLPSTLPGEVAISTTGPTEQSYEMIVDREASLITDNANVDDIEYGRVSGTATRDETVFRYAGPLLSLEHPDAGRIEIDYEEHHVTVTSTSESGAHVLFRATDGLKSQGSESIRVAQNERETIEYNGELEEIVLGPATGEQNALEVSLSPTKHLEQARKSKRLQTAVRFERKSVFDTLTETVDEYGRVRRDAHGLLVVSTDYALETVPNRTVVGFELADLDRGDRGMATIGTEEGSLIEAAVTYEWLTTDGFTEQIQVDELSTETAQGTLTSSTAPVETSGTTFETDVFRDLHSRVDDPDGDEPTEIPEFVFENSEPPVVQPDFLRSTAEYVGGLAYDTYVTVQDTASDYINDNRIQRVWDIRITGLDTLDHVYESGILEEATDGEISNCSSCVFMARVIWDVGLCGYTSRAVCTALNLTVAGGVACHVLVSAICNAPVDLDGAEYACDDVADFC